MSPNQLILNHIIPRQLMLLHSTQTQKIQELQPTNSKMTNLLSSNKNHHKDQELPIFYMGYLEFFLLYLPLILLYFDFVHLKIFDRN